MLTLTPGLSIPLWAVIQVIAIPHIYLLTGSNIPGGGNARHQAPPGVFIQEELAVWLKTVVSLVCKRGTVVSGGLVLS